MLEIIQTPFWGNSEWPQWSKFSMVWWWKNCVVTTSNVFFCFFCVSIISRESELIYQKKSGGHLAFKRVISVTNVLKQAPELPVSEHCLSCDMFDIFMFLMILCASTKKKNMHFSISAMYSVLYKNWYNESEMHCMCRKGTHKQ